MMQHTIAAIAPALPPQAAAALPHASRYQNPARERSQPLEFFAFDGEYVQRLVEGESETESESQEAVVGWDMASSMPIRPS